MWHLNTPSFSRVRLETPSLILRAMRESDIPSFVKYAGDPLVAETTLRVPHPYTEADAWNFYHAARDGRESGSWLPNILERKSDGQFVGAMGLNLSFEFRRGELGYWIGVPFWNNGYATEAARALIDYGFETLDLIRVQANHFTANPASGRVMQKAGMTYEGTLRQYFIRFGIPRDAAFYGIVRSEWEANYASSPA
jgi:RimJ/RimL family protein N-acetyltransferase